MIRIDGKSSQEYRRERSEVFRRSEGGKFLGFRPDPESNRSKRRARRTNKTP